MLVEWLLCFLVINSIMLTDGFASVHFTWAIRMFGIYLGSLSAVLFNVNQRSTIVILVEWVTPQMILCIW